MAYFRDRGPRTRRLSAFLKRRARTPEAGRAQLDRRSLPRMFRKRAVVFTDMDDFTRLVARHGILHFLMVFDRTLRVLAPLIRRQRGRLLKVEADSLLITFPDAASACAGVVAVERALALSNRRHPASEHIAFSYGIGHGELLELEEDVFGLEVNLASKLGEDRARRHEALLTPAAVDALPAGWRRRLVRHTIEPVDGQAIAVQRLKL